MGKEEKEEKAYRKLIDMCAANKKNFTIPNSAPQHASYLIKTLFKEPTGETMRIFTGKLDESVFADQELRVEAINFLKRNKNNIIKIAYQNEAVNVQDLLEGEFLNDIIEDKEIQGQVVVWNASVSSRSIPNHFAVLDATAFRYELDERTKRAIANFGDSENAENLVGIFDSIIEKSKKVYPQN